MSRRELLEFDRKQSYEATTPMTPSVDSVSSQSYLTDQLRHEAEVNEQKITKKLKMTQQSSSRWLWLLHKPRYSEMIG